MAAVPVEETLSTYYEIVSSGPSDTDNLYIKVEINKGPTALSGASEAQILGFVRNYLQTLSSNPITIKRTRVLRVEGL
jgi:hypothetical protein